MFAPMLVTAGMQADIRHALEANDIALANLEVFNLNSDAPIDDFRPALELGANLGAATATACDFGHPRPDMAERFAAFHALCASFGLKALIEPISMGATRTLTDGVKLIEAAGQVGGIVVDFLHIVRTGSSPQDVAALPAQLIGHVQICDGPIPMDPSKWGEEAAANRLYPGDGDFPIAEFLKALPSSASIGVEVPSLSRQQRGQSAQDRAHEAFGLTAQYFTSMNGTIK